MITMLTDVFVRNTRTKESRRESAPDYVEALREMARTGPRVRKKARSCSYDDGFQFYNTVFRRTRRSDRQQSRERRRFVCGPAVSFIDLYSTTRTSLPLLPSCTRYHVSPAGVQWSRVVYETKNSH